MIKESGIIIQHIEKNQHQHCDEVHDYYSSRQQFVTVVDAEKVQGDTKDVLTEPGFNLFVTGNSALDTKDKICSWHYSHCFIETHGITRIYL